MSGGASRSRCAGSSAGRDLDDAVLDAHGEGAHGQVGGQREGAPTPDVEARAVARAEGDAGLRVPVAEAEGPVVVRAAILQRVQLAVAVVDAHRVRLRVDELHLAGRNLLERAGLELSQSRVPAIRPAGGCPWPGAGRPG